MRRPVIHPRLKRVPRGITLIEVLVVIALLAVLSGIVWGVARMGKRRAQMIESTSNLRQLVLANANYAADHGTYAPAMDPSNLKRWHGSRNGPSDAFEPRGGFLNPYLGDSQEVGFCPRLEEMITDEKSWEQGSGGYGYNATYIGGTPKDPFRPAVPANIRDLHTLMFATTAFANSSGLQEYPFAEPREWVDPNGHLSGKLQPSVHFRFNGKALVAWCDGTVTAEEMSEESELNYYGGDNTLHGIGFCGPAEENGWWNPGR